MMKVGEVKMKRKVNVIEDLDGKKTVFIHDILFKGKRAMKWDEVEKYLRQYVGDICTIDDSNEVIYITYTFHLLNRKSTLVFNRVTTEHI